MNFKKAFYLLLGVLGLLLGAIGAVLPLIPAFPFLLLALFGFSKSSKKLHDWFIGTSLYKSNIESYIAGNGMSRAAKRRVMFVVTLLMSFGFFLMLRKGLYLPCGILFGVWIFHLIYFGLIVKNLREEKAVDPQ